MVSIGKKVQQKHLDYALSENIIQDETLLGIFTGVPTIGWGLGASCPGNPFKIHYMMVTNKRVIFWWRKKNSYSTADFDYIDIINIQDNNNQYKEIEINSGGKKRIRCMYMDKSDIPKAINLIKNQIHIIKEKDKTTKPQLQSEISKIKEIAELKESGIITAEEFYVKARELVGINSN